MAPQLPDASSNNNDSLLQLALSINPTKSDPFDAQQDQDALNHNRINDNATTRTSSDWNPDLLSRKVPSNATDIQSVDALIASEMAKLSVDDREKALMDVHGVYDHLTETPELIHINLLELQNEIELLPDKRAYEIAEKMDADYVQDRDFRLAFLRCEKFDCPKAALRIIRHFQMKLDLFGLEKLVLDITQDDFDSDTMDALHDFAGRFLKTRDRGGRIVNLMVSRPPEIVKTDALMRKAFYNIGVAFREEDVQRNGAVCIIFLNVRDLELSGKILELAYKVTLVNQASAMWMSAYHICYSDEAWKIHEALSKSALSKPQQVRTRVHHGSVQECLEKLQGFGIDPSSIPINAECGLTDLKEARRLLDEQRRYERLNFPPRSTIYVPFSMDVLVGKGIPFQNHPGNIRLRELVADHMKEYDKAGKLGKRIIAMEIIDMIKQSGGLFLKQDVGNQWSRVNDEAATLKVLATFRSYRQSQR